MNWDAFEQQSPTVLKTIFHVWGGGPVGGDGSGGNVSDGSGGNAGDGELRGEADEASLLAQRPLLTSCRAARFLTGCGLTAVRGPGVGDPCIGGRRE